MTKVKVLQETKDYQLVVTTGDDAIDLPARFYGVFHKEHDVMEHADTILPSAISWLGSLQKQVDAFNDKEDEDISNVELPTIQ